MFGSDILEVAMGLAFVYVLLSLVCTAVREGSEALLKTRAAHLEHGLRELLNDRGAVGLARDIYEHPLIAGLYSGDYEPNAVPKQPGAFTRGRNLPSYIPTKNFALALMDLAARGPAAAGFQTGADSTPLTLASIRANIGNLGNGRIQRMLLTAIDTAEGDLQRAQKNVENWFDSGMDRISGWYKRSTQVFLFGTGLFIAVSLNVDSIAIVEHLYHNKGVRTALAQRAEAFANQTTAGNLEDTDYGKALAMLKELQLPIGRSITPEKTAKSPGEKFFADWIAPLPGWLITALATMLGAPFWFDLLNKIMVIRSTVKPHEKSPEESSEDRRTEPPASELPVPVPAVVVPTLVAEPPVPDAPPAPAPPPDDPEEIDGCALDFLNADRTDDEDLPAAEGGVAQ